MHSDQDSFSAVDFATTDSLLMALLISGLLVLGSLMPSEMDILAGIILSVIVIKAKLVLPGIGTFQVHGW